MIEGCDARSCPDNSVCVRFFPIMYATEVCATSEMCQPDEECASSRCVRRSLEKRICVQGCGGNGDCRGGYVCQPTGENGAIALTLTPAAAPPKFCAPAAP